MSKKEEFTIEVFRGNKRVKNLVFRTYPPVDRLYKKAKLDERTTKILINGYLAYQKSK